MQYFYKASPQEKVSGKPAVSCAAPIPPNLTTSREHKIIKSATNVQAEVIATGRTAHSVLINATETQREAIEAEANVKLYPNHQYHVAAFLNEAIVASAAATTAQAAGAHAYEFLVEGTDKKPVVGADVVVWLAEDLTALAQTDNEGIARFSLIADKAAAVQVFPRENYWCSDLADVISSQHQRKVYVEAFELPYLDSVNYFYPNKSANAGQGIKVAVIDTGIDNHIDLPKMSIQKTILNGIDTEGCSDNWLSHGTHVAGIIAGQRFGIAPAVDLMGYCVFAKDKDRAESLDIATAIDFAVLDGAHIINLSLGWSYNGKLDEPVVESIERAVEAGVFVVAATGNDSADGVLFPSSLDTVCAVGALGVEGKYAVTSTHRTYKKRVYNSDGEFVAHFSNYQDNKVQVAAPGLAVISTTQRSGYTAKSGTSMAAPVVSGIAAKILSEHPKLLELQGEERVTELGKLLYNECDNLGFEKRYVGAGVPAY